MTFLYKSLKLVNVFPLEKVQIPKHDTSEPHDGVSAPALRYILELAPQLPATPSAWLSFSSVLHWVLSPSCLMVFFPPLFSQVWELLWSQGSVFSSSCSFSFSKSLVGLFHRVACLSGRIWTDTPLLKKVFQLWFALPTMPSFSFYLSLTWP